MRTCPYLTRTLTVRAHIPGHLQIMSKHVWRMFNHVDMPQSNVIQRALQCVFHVDRHVADVSRRYAMSRPRGIMWMPRPVPWPQARCVWDGADLSAMCLGIVAMFGTCRILVNISLICSQYAVQLRETPCLSALHDLDISGIFDQYGINIKSICDVLGSAPHLLRCVWGSCRCLVPSEYHPVVL